MSFSFAKRRKMRDTVNYLFQFTIGQVSDLPKFVKVKPDFGIDLDYVAMELQDGKKNRKITQKRPVIEGVAEFREHIQQMVPLVRVVDMDGNVFIEERSVAIKLLAVVMKPHPVQKVAGIMTIAKVVLNLGHFVSLLEPVTDNEIPFTILGREDRHVKLQLRIACSAMNSASDIFAPSMFNTNQPPPSEITPSESPSNFGKKTKALEDNQRTPTVAASEQKEQDFRSLTRNRGKDNLSMNGDDMSDHSMSKGDRAWGEASKNSKMYASKINGDRGASAVRRSPVSDLEAFEALQAAGYGGKEKDFYKYQAQSRWEGKGKGKADNYYDHNDRYGSKHFEDDYGGGASRREDMYSGYNDEHRLRREIHDTRKKLESLREELDMKMDNLEKDSREQKVLKSMISNLQRDRDIKAKNLRLNEGNKGMTSSLEDLMIRKGVNLLREQRTEYVGVKKYSRIDANGIDIEVGQYYRGGPSTRAGFLLLQKSDGKKGEAPEYVVTLESHSRAVKDSFIHQKVYPFLVKAKKEFTARQPTEIDVKKSQIFLLFPSLDPDWAILKSVEDPSLYGEVPRWAVLALSSDAIEAAISNGYSSHSNERLDDIESQNRKLKLLEDQLHDYNLKLRSINRGIVESDEQAKMIEDEYQAMENKLRFLLKEASFTGMRTDSWHYDKGSKLIERGHDSYNEFNVDQQTHLKLSTLSRQHSEDIHHRLTILERALNTVVSNIDNDKRSIVPLHREDEYSKKKYVDVEMLEIKLDNSKNQIRSLEDELKEMQEQRDNSSKEIQVLEKRLANVVYKHGQAMLEMDELSNKLEYAYSKAAEAEENLRRSNELSAMEMEETITLMKQKEREIAKASSRFSELEAEFSTQKSLYEVATKDLERTQAEVEMLENRYASSLTTKYEMESEVQQIREKMKTMSAAAGYQGDARSIDLISARKREEIVKMQLEDSLSSARVSLIDISDLKRKYVASTKDADDDAPVQDLEARMRTAYTCVKNHGEEIERLRRELSSVMSSRMEIELNLKPRNTIPKSVFEETSLALKEAEKRLSETKKENDNILSELESKLKRFGEIQTNLRSLSTCDAIIQLESQMKKAHEDKDQLQEQYEDAKKQVEELKLEARMREHEIAATRSAVQMMEKEAAEARVSLEGIQSQSADEATQLRAGVLVIQDGMKKSQGTIERVNADVNIVEAFMHSTSAFGQMIESSLQQQLLLYQQKAEELEQKMIQDGEQTKLDLSEMEARLQGEKEAVKKTEEELQNSRLLLSKVEQESQERIATLESHVKEMSDREDFLRDELKVLNDERDKLDTERRRLDANVVAHLKDMQQRLYELEEAKAGEQDDDTMSENGLAKLEAGKRSAARIEELQRQIGEIESSLAATEKVKNNVLFESESVNSKLSVTNTKLEELEDEKNKAITELRNREEALIQTQKDLAEAIEGREALRVELDAKEDQLQQTLKDMTSKVQGIQLEKEEEIRKKDEDLAAKAKEVEEQTFKVTSLQEALRVAKEQDEASKGTIEDLKMRLDEAKRQTQSAEEEVGRHQLQEKRAAEDYAADLNRAKEIERHLTDTEGELSKGADAESQLEVLSSKMAEREKEAEALKKTLESERTQAESRLRGYEISQRELENALRLALEEKSLKDDDIMEKEAQLTSEVSRLEREKLVLNNQNDAREKELSEAIASKDMELDAASTMMKKLDSELAEIKAERESKDKELNDLRQNLRETDQAATALKLTLDTNYVPKEEVETREAELNKAMEEQTKLLQEAQAAMSVTRIERDSVTKESEKLRQRLKELQESVQTYESSAVDLKRDSEEKAAVHASEVSRLQSELQQAEEARSNIENSLSKHEETFKQKTKEMAQLIEDRDSEVEKKSATIQEMTASLQSLESSLADTKEEKARSELQVTQLTDKLREAEEAVKDAQERTLSASQESAAELETRKQDLKEREEQVISLQEAVQKAEESSKQINERLRGREEELISQLAIVQEELQKERQEHNRVVEEKENQLLSAVEKAKSAEVELKEVKKRTDLEQKAGEQHAAKVASLESDLEESKAERIKVEDALLKAEETYKINVAELNHTIEKKTTESRDNAQALQAMTTNARALEEELGKLREEKARQDIQLLDLGEKLRVAERTARQSTDNSASAAEKSSAELESAMQELQERESEVRALTLEMQKAEERARQSSNEMRERENEMDAKLGALQADLEIERNEKENIVREKDKLLQRAHAQSKSAETELRNLQRHSEEERRIHQAQVREYESKLKEAINSAYESDRSSQDSRYQNKGRAASSSGTRKASSKKKKENVEKAMAAASHAQAAAALATKAANKAKAGGSLGPYSSTNPFESRPVK